jgi:hypothetical protein
MTLERDDVKHAWARRVLMARKALLNFSALALQRGIVSRDSAPALQLLVDDVLQQLAEERPHDSA